MKKFLALSLASAVVFTNTCSVLTSLHSCAIEQAENLVNTLESAVITDIKSDETNVNFSWNAVPNAKGYIVKIFNANTNQWEIIYNQAETSCTIQNLKSGTEYRFSVTSYADNTNDLNASNNTIYGNTAEFSAITRVSSVNNIKISSNSTNGYTLSWNTVPNAAKYYIYRYNSNSKKFSLIKKTANNFIKVNNRKPSQKDIYLIKTASVINGRLYLSDGSKKTVSTLPSSVEKFNVSVKKATAKITWSKVKGASGYKIYYKPANENKFVLFKDIKKGSTTSYNTKAFAGKKVYLKIRPYVKVDNKNYYGKFSKTVKKRFFNDISYNNILKNYRNSFDLTYSNAQGYKMSQAKRNALLNQITCLGGTESFAMLDLDSGVMIGYNAKSYLETASTVKMPFMLYSLKQMDKGKATMNTKVTYAPEDYNDGTGEVKNNPFGTTFTLKNIFHKVCFLSDNSAYYILQKTFGINGYNKFISSLGCRTSVDRYANRWGYVSAVDSAKEWISMYDYFKNGKYGKFIRNELAHSGFSNFRIGLSGRKCTVYSKCGFTENLHHDTSVVETNHPYVLICLTTTVSAPRLQAVARAADDVHNEMWKYFDSIK